MKQTFDRLAIEDSLPRRYRGTGRGFRRLVRDIPLRIAVTGTRGKTSTTLAIEKHLRQRGHDTMAKVTGTTPYVVRNGEPVPTPRYGPVMLDETMWEIKRHAPCGAAIIENQAIAEYGMRIVHQALRPHVIVITNVRRDHQDQVGREPQRIARAFGRSVRKGATVLCGEQDPTLAAIVQEEVQRRKAHYVQVDEHLGDPPGMVNHRIVHQLLERVHGTGLPDRVLDATRTALQRTNQFHPGPVPAFDASEVNDVDSTHKILRHISPDPMPMVWVLYLRGDRRERSHAFLQFMRDRIEEGYVHDIHLAGRHAQLFAKRLGFPARIHRRSPRHVEAVAQEVMRSGLPVMMAANGADPWPRRLANLLGASTRTRAGACPVPTPAAASA